MQPYIGGIPAYGIFSSIGLFCMMMMLYLRNKKLSFREYLFLMASMIIGVGIGSKILFIATQIPDIIANFSMKYMINKIITSGFVFYGGLFGAILGCVIFSKLFKYNVRDMLNFVSPGYSSFHACGRIGCFFAGCCYGKVSTWVHLYRYCTRYFSIKDVSKISVLKYSPFPVAFTFSRIPIGIDFNHTSTIFPL